MYKPYGQIGDYGVDAPPVIHNLTLAGSAAIVVGIVLCFALASVQPLIAVILLIWGLLAGARTLQKCGS